MGPVIEEMREEEECLPNAVEDEEELDEDTAKGQDAAHEHSGEGLGVQRLLRHLPGNLVRADGSLDGLENASIRKTERRGLTLFLKPKNAPINVMGTEMNIQRARRASRVPKGTAAEEPLVQRRVLVKKKIPKRMPGMRKLVRTTFVFQWTPWKARILKIEWPEGKGLLLYRRADT